jgi:hypothetical protein
MLLTLKNYAELRKDIGEGGIEGRLLMSTGLQLDKRNSY